MAERFEVAPFSISDSERFVDAFSSAIGGDIDGKRFCEELTKRGFQDFIGHPLMLILACVLKTGPLKSIPSNSLGLIRRALDTLTFRWDEPKGLARDSASPVDGEVRQRCLMRVAYESTRMPVGTELVEAQLRKQLLLEQCEGVDTRRLLDEMARWYGILVSTASGEWEFVHKALHDYLAARYWVESGAFNPAILETWTTRASYAACLLPDATNAICCSLRLSGGLTGFLECLHNRAAFEGSVVARALHRSFKDKKLNFSHNRETSAFSLEPRADFFGIAKTEFLRDILSIEAEPSEGRLILSAYCFAELHKRAETISLERLPNYLKTLVGQGWMEITVIRHDGTQYVAVDKCVAA